MTETDDVGIVHCAITCSDGSSTAIKRDIDRTDLPPLVTRNAPIFVILNIIFYHQFWKSEICCS